MVECAVCETSTSLGYGVGAYDKGRLIVHVACSADCDTMYQIVIDILPEYRRQGKASALAKRIIEAGIVPFYCAAWSNILSVRNAVKRGFRPAWVELTVVKKLRSYKLALVNIIYHAYF